MKKVTAPRPSGDSKRKASLNLYLAKQHLLIAIQALEGTDQGNALAGILQEMMRLKETLA